MNIHFYARASPKLTHGAMTFCLFLGLWNAGERAEVAVKPQGLDESTGSRTMDGRHRARIQTIVNASDEFPEQQAALEDAATIGDWDCRSGIEQAVMNTLDVIDQLRGSVKKQAFRLPVALFRGF